MSTRHLSTHVFEAGPPRLEIDAAELRVTAGPDRGVELALGADSVRIGSAADCELVLHDPTVSSRHAEIQVNTRGYSIRDLGSKNGVVIGTVMVDRAPLVDGMKIRLGESMLVVKALGRRHALPLARPGQLGQLVARSIKMRAVVATIERLAAADTTVLLEGETGTGKEVVGQALHAAGPRAHGPFVVFDCGAAAPQLIASELFGHEKGAFTGASAARAGAFENAHDGTLFLDEVGELPLELQPVLLRMLEARTVRRVGGGQDRAFDVRVIAATNRNLAEEVRQKRFREDLYYRLAVARVRLPPLRERPEDVPGLAGLFAAQAGIALSPEIVAVLAAYDWPGNVRELKNTIERTAATGSPIELGERDRPGLADRRLLVDGARLRELPEARQLAGDAFERGYLEEALARAGGNLSRAAELAGVSRQLMTKLVAKHGLRVKDRPTP